MGRFKPMRSISIALLTAFALPLIALAQPKVVTTNSDLLSLVQIIGGNEVSVSNILPSGQEPHSLPLKPSVVEKIKSAQYLITIGLDHEPWLPDAISSSGNQRVSPGSAGY